MKLQAIGLWACLVLVASSAGAGESWIGKVVGVSDGDTVTVLHDRTPVKIRLHGVDAPEKAQPFGEQARQFTSGLVFGRQVRVEVLSRDKYGRSVGRIHLLAPERSLQQELLTAGLAWWYRQYSPRDTRLAALEEQARKARRGLWAEASPTPPWQWRHAGKARAASAAGSRDQAKPPAGMYRGNVKSRTLHAPGCRDYQCKHCTAGFATVEEAQRQGYRTHAACLPAFAKCYGECLRRSQPRAVAAELIQADCRRRCSK